MDLSTLKPRPGATHRVKRLGCGESSGHGKTSGKGHKGQKARSGGSIRLGFEGGQMPLARKIPKRGFNNKRFRVVFEVVSLGRIGSAFVEGSVVDRESLVAKGLVRGRDGVCVKVLGSGDLCKRLVFRSVSFSSAARAKAAASGSSLE